MIHDISPNIKIGLPGKRPEPNHAGIQKYTLYLREDTIYYFLKIIFNVTLAYMYSYIF